MKQNNIVVIPAFCDGELPYYAQKCIEFWKKWCDRHEVDLYVIQEKLYPFEEVPPHIQKLYVYRILEAQGVEFDQCLLADWDTFPMPDAKNVFEFTDGTFGICLDYGWATSIIRSVDFMAQFFNHRNVNWDNYFNSGFFVFSKSHKDIFEECIAFCTEYADTQKKYPELFHGDQTVLNYIVHESTATTILPRSFMVHDYFLDIFLKNYTDHNGQYMDSQQYMTSINFVHITRDAEFRDGVVDLVEKRFYSKP
jgi:hypothetical protein